MNKNEGKYSFLFKKDGPYTIVSDELFYLKIEETGFTPDFPVAGPLQSSYDVLSKMFTGKGLLRNMDPKLEECRKEIDLYVKQIESGSWKPVEWFKGEKVNKPGTIGKDDYVDTSITANPSGRQFFLGKAVEPQAVSKEQIAREKRMIHQGKPYTQKDLEYAKNMFRGCPPYLVAGQVMCTQGVESREAACILPYLGVNLSLKELEEIRRAIPEEKIGTVESIRAFNSKKYQDHLGNLKKTIQEARHMGLTAYLEAHSPDAPGI